MDLRRIFQVRYYEMSSKLNGLTWRYQSELSDTRRIIPSLLSSDVSQLSPETVTVYIQSAAKIFGTWAAALTERWDEDDLSELKKVVDSTIGYLRAFSSNPNFEVQERVSWCLQVLFLRR